MFAHLFNDKTKNNIHLTPDEILIITRSLSDYSNQLKKLISNRPDVPNDDLLFTCLDSYFNLVECAKRKIEDMNKQ